jgi:4-hydroxybenzoate polyprenyltransferase
MRPVGWLPPLFGLVIGLANAHFSDSLSATLAALAFGPLLSGAAYVVNFMADAGEDRLSNVRKDKVMAKQPFAAGDLNRIQGVVLSVILTLLGMTCLLLVNGRVAVIGCIVMALALAYSLPPRLKARPGLDVASNAAMVALCYVGGWATLEPAGQSPVLPALWLFFLVAATYLLTEIVDYSVDRETRVTTTAVALGPERTTTLAWCLYVVSLLFFALACLTELHLSYLIIAPGLALGAWGLTKRLRNRSDAAGSRRLALLATVASGVAILSVVVAYSVLALVYPSLWF